MEQGDVLHLARGTARHWLAPGGRVAVERFPTHFGAVSYAIDSPVDQGVMRVTLDLPRRAPARETVLHIRHPCGLPIRAVRVDDQAWDLCDPESIRFPGTSGRREVEIGY